MIATIARPLPVIVAAIVEDAAFDEALVADAIASGALDAPDQPFDVAAQLAELNAILANADRPGEHCLACGERPQAYGGLCHACLGTEPTPPDGGGLGGGAVKPDARSGSGMVDADGRFRAEGQAALRTVQGIQIAMMALDNGMEMLKANLARAEGGLDLAEASLAGAYHRDWCDEEIAAYWEAQDLDPEGCYDLEDVA